VVWQARSDARRRRLGETYTLTRLARSVHQPELKPFLLEVHAKGGGDAPPAAVSALDKKTAAAAADTDGVACSGGGSDLGGFNRARFYCSRDVFFQFDQLITLASASHACFCQSRSLLPVTLAAVNRARFCQYYYLPCLCFKHSHNFLPSFVS
jgi:hypothetical protein